MLRQRKRAIFGESDIILESWILLKIPGRWFVRGALRRCGVET
jgi:hypothetical protein